MFCKYCGSKLPEGAAFCENCGKKVRISEDTPQMEKAAINVPNEPAGSWQQAKVVKKTSPKVYGIFIAAVAVVLVAVFLLNGKRTVNLNDYSTVTYEGYDGYGTATSYFDSDKFIADYKNKIKFSENGKAYSQFYENAAEALYNEWIYGSLDRTEDLSNNDTITYQWSCSEEQVEKLFNCKLKYKDKEFEVSGLQELTTFDPFEDVTVEFSGIAPDGRAEVHNNSKSEVVQSLFYALEQNDGLSNGDMVTVWIESNWSEDVKDYCARNYGMVPEPLYKSYEVSGLGSHVSTLEEIPAETLQKMLNQAEDAFRAYVANHWSEHEVLEEMSYLGSYLLVPKADTYGSNMLYLVYKITASDNYEDENIHNQFEYYYTAAFYDLMLLPDGTCSVDLSYYDAPDTSFYREVKYGDDFWDYDRFYYYGYENMDSLFNNSVTAYIDRYSYESNVTE